MTTQRDPETTLSLWLAEQARPLPTETKRAIAVGLRSTTQRKRRWWHTTALDLGPAWQIAGAVTVVAVLVIGAAAISGQLGAGVGPGSTRPSASAAPDTSTWTAFASKQYGFDARYPAGWLAISSTAEDRFAESETSANAFSGRSLELADGETLEAWLARYCQGDPGCVPDRWPTVTIDGRQARLRDQGSTLDAFVFADDRVYVISAEGAAAGDRALFEAFLSTVRLHPEAVEDDAGADGSPEVGR